MSLDIRGCGTALVTPFRKDGTLDLDALRRLVQFQLRAGIDFLVPCGTTGETPTLEHAEYLGVVRTVVQEAAGKVPVIAGVGGNNTRKLIDLAAQVCGLGVQGILSVAPYYNKPTQEGLYQHFRAIAESTNLPVILYNVPGRTSSNLEPPTVARLSQIPNIIAIKESSGNMEKVMQMMRESRPGFQVLVGSATTLWPSLLMGANGGILAFANAAPYAAIAIWEAYRRREEEAGRDWQNRIARAAALVTVKYGVPGLKYAMDLNGYYGGPPRLPLVPPSAEAKREIKEAFIDLKG